MPLPGYDQNIKVALKRPSRRPAAHVDVTPTFDNLPEYHKPYGRSHLTRINLFHRIPPSRALLQLATHHNEFLRSEVSLLIPAFHPSYKKPPTAKKTEKSTLIEQRHTLRKSIAKYNVDKLSTLILQSRLFVIGKSAYRSFHNAVSVRLPWSHDCSASNKGHQTLSPSLPGFRSTDSKEPKSSKYHPAKKKSPTMTCYALMQLYLISNRLHPST